MKKLTTILQLPIMDILNGKRVGQTKDIIMNLDTKDIAYVLDDSIVASLYVIKGDEIQGIGRDVILIKTSESIQNSQEDTELASLLGDYYSVIGLDVITMEGNIEGTIVDLSIDEKQKKIAEIELENGYIFDARKIISISDKYVFVQDSGSNDGTPREMNEALNIDSEVDTQEGMEVEAKVMSEVVSGADSELEIMEEETAVVEKDESSYLIGMTLSEDVANVDGTFIVNKGTVLTEELINQAREYGVFASLIMNAE